MFDQLVRQRARLFGFYDNLTKLDIIRIIKKEEDENKAAEKLQARDWLLMNRFEIFHNEEDLEKFLEDVKKKLEILGLNMPEDIALK